MRWAMGEVCFFTVYAREVTVLMPCIQLCNKQRFVFGAHRYVPGASMVQTIRPAALVATSVAEIVEPYFETARRPTNVCNAPRHSDFGYNWWERRRQRIVATILDG